MSWAALPVEPACMGKAVGEAGRPLMLCGARLYIITDAYKEPENPMEWLPCPRCGLRPLVWEFDNARATACGCGTDCYRHWSVQAESIMSVIKRSDSGHSAEAYDK